MPENNFKLCLQGLSARTARMAREAVAAASACPALFFNAKMHRIAPSAAAAKAAHASRASGRPASGRLRVVPPFLHWKALRQPAQASGGITNPLNALNKWGHNCA
jgi:predicted dehydrogenase